MKKILLVFTSLLFVYSCGILHKSKDYHEFDGFYLCVKDGKAYPFYNDSNKAVMIDTAAIANFTEVTKVEKRKSKDIQPPYEVYIELDSMAALKMFLITSMSYKQTIALIIDDKLMIAPIINSPINDGKILITGLDKKTAKDIVRQLKDKMKN